MVNTVKFSQFAPLVTNGANSLVGLSNGNNAISAFPLSWTTAQRPIAPTDGTLGYNTDIKEYEFWNALTVMWVQLASGGVGVTDIFTGTGLTGGPITSVGTISFAAIAAKSLWANFTSGVAVPTIVPLTDFLLSANNLSDLTNVAVARANIGLAIGVNVEAWSAILDEISAGVWPGATSITTLGTITTGTWHGSPVTVPFGGTGNTTFTAYSVICAGVTNTGAMQNVSGVGTAGQVLTSNGTGTLPTWQSGGSGDVNPGLINELAYYAASGATLSGLPTAANGVLVTSAGSVPSISSTLPAAVQANITAVGTVTSGVWQGSVIGMAFGGTNANLTATVNNLVFSTASALALLATANNGVLVTSAGGVPSIGTTLPALVQSNITQVGTITSGLWNGSLITVPFGGTGVASFTAFELIAAGTTSTGALQNVSGTGVIGQVLTSQGAGALPQWANATGTGTVNSGGLNDLAYYASAGNTVSGLATGNNGILVTSNSGVPSISTTLPNAVQLNITSVGTLTVGLWNASTITVPFGGTGNTTFTAFSVICAGVTATAAFQNVSGVGLSGQVLTSNGGGTLPTWQNATGTGTVNSANANDLAFYAATGNTVSGLASANGGTLVTSNTGVPSILASTGVTGNILQTVSGAAPAWSTATYPATTIANNILFSSATNVVDQIAAVNGGVLVSNNTGVPSMLANPGAALRILQSANAAIPAWSTATYPATAGSAGNVLTSDGTNWNSVTPGSFQPFIANGRLTLTSGLPVTTADVTAATSIFFTPYLGNQIALFDGVATWNTLTFTEITISVPATTSTMYDLFAFNSSGTVTFDAPLAWTNDTTRATALVLQNGVYVKSGATTRRYIGSFRTTTVSGQTQDALAGRYVWNYSNRVNRAMKVVEATSTWTYSTATYRQANANTANQLDCVIGVAEDSVFVYVHSTESSSNATTGYSGIGIGFSSTTVNSAITTVMSVSGASVGTVSHHSQYNGVLPIGRNFLVWLEKGEGANTQTWRGTNGATYLQSGIQGYLRG